MRSGRLMEVMTMAESEMKRAAAMMIAVMVMAIARLGFAFGWRGLRGRVRSGR